MDSPEIDPEIAAQMGFSSFGSVPKPNSKKRKPSPLSPNPPSPGSGRGRGGPQRGRGGYYNQQSGHLGYHVHQYQLPITAPTQEARLDYAKGAEVTNKDPGYTSGFPPLGPSTQASGNPDEIELDISEEEAITAKSIKLPGIATILKPVPPAPAASATFQPGAGLRPEVLLSPLRRTAYWAASQADDAGKNPDGSWNWAALRRGVQNAEGVMVFFNHTFIEDPWAGLLQPDEA